MTDLLATPDPVSDEAIRQGCRCAVLDNAHGRGYRGKPGIFVITGDCPLHGLGSDWGEGNPPAQPVHLKSLESP